MVEAAPGNTVLRHGDLSRLEIDRVVHVADYHARRSAAVRQLPCADRDDLRQDIAVEVLGRLTAFDPARAAFGTFVDLLAAHAASRHGDRARRTSRNEAPFSDDASCLGQFCSATPDGTPAPTASARNSSTWGMEQRLAFQALADAVPEAMGIVLAVIGWPSPSSRSDPTSRTTAWRRRRELRLLLLTAGLDATA